MKRAVEWMALAIVALVFLWADHRHIATSNFNAFMLLLLGLVTGLVFFLKAWHRERGERGK